MSMDVKMSKPNSDLEILYAGLDEVQMSSTERLRAKVRLAQADAIAESAIGIINFFKRLLKPWAERPVGQPSKLAG
jgi:hypothetical protein